ncbi:hypothetical protein ACFYOV_19665 [Streptomyces sp. NPDC005931]|uniref:hypothetical protein n=1 Tax=Streptomyces sp. NPDC005931 TaxID=3364737 RepID=UPI00367ACEB8
MTAHDYDNQLLESVSVRRRRLRDALLFGAQRQRRTLDERLGRVSVGLVVAAVLCAGCVGWSFLSHRVIGKSPYATPTAPPAQPPSASSATPSAPSSASSVTPATR